MHSFDHRYYPHILDLIFDHADTATQAALSQVCKQWRQRWTAEYFWVTGFNAQREWGCQCSGVIYSDDSEDDTDTESVQSEDNPQAYWFFTPKGEEISLESLASFDWLRRCRVVDLSNEAWSLKCDHDLYIDTLRVPYPHSGGYWCYKKAIVHLTHLKCRRVIFDNTLRLLPGYDISKLVVNFRSADFGHFRFLDLATHPIKVDHVVFIAHALNKHPTKIHKSTARPADVRAAIFFDIFRRMCKTERFTYVAPERSAQVEGHAGVEQCTIEEYRARLGEKEFAIETDFVTPLEP